MENFARNTRLEVGNIGVILNDPAQMEAYRLFRVMLFDSGLTRTFKRLELDVVDSFDDADEMDFTVPAPPAVKSKGRFAVPQSDEDIDKLADARYAKSTSRQTTWAVVSELYART